jgi:hypothetical protein
LRRATSKANKSPCPRRVQNWPHRLKRPCNRAQKDSIAASAGSLARACPCVSARRVSAIPRPCLWQTPATAPASGPQKPFRERRTRHNCGRRGSADLCALLFEPGHKGEICGTVPRLAVVAMGTRRFSSFVWQNTVFVSALCCKHSEVMAQTTVPVYLTGKLGSMVYTANRQGTAVRMLVTPKNPISCAGAKAHPTATSSILHHSTTPLFSPTAAPPRRVIASGQTSSRVPGSSFR